MTPIVPSFTSLALTGEPPPDWADVVLTALPVGSSGDARHWAEQVFSMEHGPWPVLALLALRQRLVALIGVERARPDVFDVSAVQGQEALIVANEAHLSFRCAVGVDHQAGLLRVTTAVWLRGWRGRLYFAPVSLVHDPVTRAMMRGAVRRGGGTS